MAQGLARISQNSINTIGVPDSFIFEDSKLFFERFDKIAHHERSSWSFH